MKKPVTIVIEKSTRDRMKHMGRKDQTYTQLIDELLSLKEDM